jgi:ribokinase
MARPSRICVVGSANVDLTFRTPRLPRAGETLAGRSLHIGMGGKGANQAVAAARLGAEVALVACVGSDSFGAQALASYRAEGIDTRCVRQDVNHPTGTAGIIVDDGAENCIVIVAGANAALSSIDVRAAARVIENADALLCQLETPWKRHWKPFAWPEQQAS